MSSLPEHDPDPQGRVSAKWVPVCRKRSCSNKKIERDDDFEETPSRSGSAIPFGNVMDQALIDWKLAVERCWLAEAPDWQETARLVAGIAASSDNLTLRQAATQALPSLRNASARWSAAPGIFGLPAPPATPRTRSRSAFLDRAAPAPRRWCARGRARARTRRHTARSLQRRRSRASAAR